MRIRMRIAVVAFGDSSHGDHAIGLEIISHIDRTDLDEDVIIIDGGQNVLRTLESISGFDGLIVVDAASMGETPGTVRTYDLNNLILNDTSTQVSFHGIKIDSELLYAHKFLNLPRTIIIGIEPEAIGGTEVSECLRSNMSIYVDAVIRAVARFTV
jgi:hydrogenase maturation protease